MIESSSLFIVITQHHPRSFESIPLNYNICFRAAHILLPTEQTPTQLTDAFIIGMVAIKIVKDTWNYSNDIYFQKIAQGRYAC